MIRSVWANRIASLRDQLRQTRLQTMDAKRARGKMAHWSTYVMRDGPAGLPMMESHMLRPTTSLAPGSNVTLCGWHEASFKSAKAYDLPFHTLFAPSPNPTAFCGDVGLIGCQICWDVMNDIATWIMLGADRRVDDEAHLLWSASPLRTACTADNYRSTPFDPVTFGALTHKDWQRCPTCVAIHGRLWGAERPEQAYLSYTTNEEAAAARRVK